MIVSIPVSIGELIDKISILLIKSDKISDLNKNNLIKKELNQLREILDSINLEQNKIESYLIDLKEINLKLWNVEDEIRTLEGKKKFNQKFIELARSVYKLNDVRAKIKLEINNEFGSSIIEIKSYKDY